MMTVEHRNLILIFVPRKRYGNLSQTLIPITKELYVFIEVWFFYFQEKIYFVKFIFRCIIEPKIFNTVEIDEKYILYAEQLYPEMFTL